MTQPDRAPPEEWRIRTDAGARKVVDRLDEVKTRLSAIDQEVAIMKALQASNVTFRGAMLGAAGILATVLVTFGTVIARAEGAAKEAGSEALVVARETQAAQRQLEQFVRVELQDFKRELKADIADVKAEVRNATRAVERTRPKPPKDGGP